jgi:hypothetical protein
MIFIVLIVVVVLVVGIGLALSPMLNKKGDAAIDRIKESMGSYDLFENKAVAMGTEPDSAGGVRGLAAMAVNADTLMVVTWSGPNEFSLPRSAITSVETEATDPAGVQKALITVHFDTGDGPALARIRVPQPVEWLDALGYDWGPEGKPEVSTED